jgi:hypothetical protein
MGCSGIQDICDTLPGNMSDPERESEILSLPGMHDGQIGLCGHRKKKKKLRDHSTNFNNLILCYKV